MVLVWCILGVGFYLWARTAHGPVATRVVMEELKTGHSDLEETVSGS
jgi:hypothetical protein